MIKEKIKKTWRKAKSDLIAWLARHLRTWKRTFIVWYYSRKEPYKGRRKLRRLYKTLKKFNASLVVLNNNIVPMAQALMQFGVAVSNVGKSFEKNNSKCST